MVHIVQEAGCAQVLVCMLQKVKSLAPTKNRTLVPWLANPLPSNYTERAILAPEKN
jgi:hypothetical protein